MSGTPQSPIGSCYLVGPAGQKMQVPFEVYDAIMQFAGEIKRSGEVVLEFSGGGFAAIEARVVKKFRGPKADPRQDRTEAVDPK